MRARFVIGCYAFAFGTAALFSAPFVMAQQAQQGPTIEQRIGMEIGATIVRAAALAGQVEQLQALVAQRDKTITELQAQITELKKATSGTGGAGGAGAGAPPK